MKTKYILYGLLLLAVITSIYLTIHYNNPDDGLSGINLADTSMINFINIKKGNAEIKLQKKGKKWTLNNGFEANTSSVKKLLRIFMNLEISGFIPENEKENTSKLIKEQGTLIEFTNNNKTINSYWIGNYDKVKNATLLMTRSGDLMYAVAPGLTKNLTDYSSLDLVIWRTRKIFNFPVEDIELLSFIDQLKKENSFSIHRNNDSLILLDINKKQVNCDKNKISLYMSYYSSVEYESVMVQKPEIEKTYFIKQNPDFTIEIKGNSGVYCKLDLYPIFNDKSFITKDLNKLAAIINNENQPVIISYFSIDPVIKEISYFKK
ncbi:MAG: hypothetical protein U0W24_08910 [Bacteroidales bacterium]